MYAHMTHMHRAPMHACTHACMQLRFAFGNSACVVSACTQTLSSACPPAAICASLSRTQAPGIRGGGREGGALAVAVPAPMPGPKISEMLKLPWLLGQRDRAKAGAALLSPSFLWGGCKTPVVAMRVQHPDVPFRSPC